MVEYIVAIDHITYYAVQAEDEVSAIDLVLEGEGLEIASETRDAYITEYEAATRGARRAPRHPSHTPERSMALTTMLSGLRRICR
jgi:hypothetical protein